MEEERTREKNCTRRGAIVFFFSFHFLRQTSGKCIEGGANFCPTYTKKQGYFSDKETTWKGGGLLKMFGNLTFKCFLMGQRIREALFRKRFVLQTTPQPLTSFMLLFPNFSCYFIQRKAGNPNFFLSKLNSFSFGGLFFREGLIFFLTIIVKKAKSIFFRI